MKKKSFIQKAWEDIAGKLFLVLVILILFTMVMSSGVLQGEPISSLFTKGFLTANNVRQLLYKTVIQLCIMCGMSCILITGSVDLSAAGQACLCTMVFAWCCENGGLPWGVCIIIALVLAVCFGLINTLLVTKFHFPAFIATIGMSSVYGGLCSLITNGYNINISHQDFLAIAKWTVGGVVPVIFIFAVVCVILTQFMLSKTTFGRGVFMAGGNPAAARLAGINVNRTLMILFIFNSVMACIGGLLWTCQMGLANPTAITGNAPDMTVISAAVLGGVAFSGGKGNLVGPFIGLLLIDVLDNTLTVIGVSTYWNVVAQGALLAIALAFDYFEKQKAKRELLQR